MKIFNTTRGLRVEHEDRFFDIAVSGMDDLLSCDDLQGRLRECIAGKPVDAPPQSDLLAPVQTQEVWASGVTYYRSRNARMEESKDAGGGSFYDRVYAAERPELFFKASGHRVVGPGAPVRIRSDASWSVPEPELTLVIDKRGNIVGYTVGNDMSSRDIEGENPLYLPQAKVYDGSCALGPCILLATEPISRSTGIQLQIERGGAKVFEGSTTLAELKRDPKELVHYLFRDQSFPAGAFLLTGTGIVPGDDFTLNHGDLVSITIDNIGTLENPVA